MVDRKLFCCSYILNPAGLVSLRPIYGQLRLYEMEPAQKCSGLFYWPQEMTKTEKIWAKMTLRNMTNYGPVCHLVEHE